jgi:hypothetical protein
LEVTMAKKKPTKADLEAREQALKNAAWLRELAEKKLAAIERSEQQTS